MVDTKFIHSYSNTITTGPEQARAIFADLTQAETEARQRFWHDRNLSVEGRQAAEAEAFKQAKTVASSALTALTNKFTGAVAQIHQIADAARPRRSMDAGYMVMSGQKWQQAEALLNAGLTDMRELINQADLDTTLAIEEFGNTWLLTHEVHATQILETTALGDPDWFTTAILVRLAQLSDPDTGLAIITAVTADLRAQQFTGWTAALTSRINGISGTSSLEAAINSGLIEQSIDLITNRPNIPALTSEAA